MLSLLWLSSISLILKVCVGPSCQLQSDFILEQLQLVISGSKNSVLSNTCQVSTIQCLNACKRPCNVAVYKHDDTWEDVEGSLKKQYPISLPGFTSYEMSKSCFSKIKTKEDINRIVSLVEEYLLSIETNTTIISTTIT